MVELRLPIDKHESQNVRLQEPRSWKPAGGERIFNRLALAAAHVVADPWAEVTPFQESAIDIEKTLRFREHLWDLGFGVAEAMDTAQRGGGLNWKAAQTVIRETIGLASRKRDAVVYSGAGTDHLEARPSSIDDVIEAYEEQLGFVQGAGGRVIVMASRALAQVAGTPADYEKVYSRVFEMLDRPAILHWLGPMFDPALEGYWGKTKIEEAMEVCLGILGANADKVEGIKISLLDKNLEIDMRRRLPEGVRMFTGDDFNYPQLIAGDEEGHSDALLGIFDPIAPAASAALGALGRGDEKEFHEILDPTVPLAREIFRAPTQFYKTGVVFLAYLSGHQNHFVMVRGQQSGRSLLHLVRVFRLANDIGLLPNPELAAARMRHFLALHGFEQ